MGNRGSGYDQAVSLRYFAPAPDLRRHLSAYYIFRADLPQMADLVRADTAQLRFMISGAGSYGFGDGRVIGAPEISLLGPTTAATRFDVVGPVLVFGVGILPAGWASLVEDDASLFADLVVDAVDVFGGMLEDALDAMRFDDRPSRMIAVVDAIMRGLLADAADAPYWFTHLTDRWLTDALSPAVDTLVKATGVSGRQVERLARRIYGAPPKLLARKYRALRAAARFVNSTHWADAAGDAFYDQSHFIREFKTFTGLTPLQFQRTPTPVTKLTLERGKLSTLPRLTLLS
ncbi:transcriptional regulator, AraC family [Sphingomonas laterariae]|uniref:Transcriptional regulator, AraC family n=1 Tax=Edaphosphingomonas laterariae TaxID=861865 RepID=A0A239F3H8_9SPHN|nr:helix-turn-helix domain-containing protein [Sphingomonas laterariae]SNS51466.1 transcriptional regulator, AraC family [Sphingomonas laterariae]